MRIDARVPVLFAGLDDAAADDAVLLEADHVPDGRIGISFRPGPGVVSIGCPCCTPRGPLAQTLSDMFMARAKGDIPFFRRIVAIPETEAGRATMIAALTDDPVCAARFRIV